MSALDHGARLHESRPALSKHIATLRRAAVEFAARAGADDLQQENVGLATSEAVSNSVIHAYSDGAVRGEVIVTAWLDHETIVVTVGDEGRGMVARDDSPGLGLGLPLIARVTERFVIESRSPGPGVLLRMSFALRASE